MNFTGKAFNYDASPIKYSPVRKTDPAIAGFVTEALGNATTILNVGAGTGSYEPANRMVIAVEPSAGNSDSQPANLPPLMPQLNCCHSTIIHSMQPWL